MKKYRIKQCIVCNTRVRTHSYEVVTVVCDTCWGMIAQPCVQSLSDHYDDLYSVLFRSVEIDRQKQDT